MITKGIVTEIISSYSVRVRLPIFDYVESSPNSPPPSQLRKAIVCAMPNSFPNLRVGDVVIVGFEDNDFSKPIILGCLSYANQNQKTLPTYKASKLDVKSVAELPEKTTIGAVTGNEIFALSGIKSNIQNQLNILEKKITSGASSGSGTSSSPTAGAAVAVNYSSLSNKPQINGVTLNGNVSLSTLGVAASVHTHTVSDITNFPSVPTKTSQLTNDSGYITSSDLVDLVNNLRGIDSVETQINEIRGIE